MDCPELFAEEPPPKIQEGTGLISAEKHTLLLYHNPPKDMDSLPTQDCDSLTVGGCPGYELKSLFPTLFLNCFPLKTLLSTHSSHSLDDTLADGSTRLG
ncbi:hypothetical protein DSO57_1036273 [Entomophthora muscae]|uniref:Uncharacterized protein n=1 Tax=Entomophthora muscae TaxID=34485 RepID=A0ACC2TL86_9FUNG|nr:hypothetical protein DSO57_1036273 [Entomophthora muscae]